MWTFGDLINFKGGMDTFSTPFHNELCDFITTPQREANTEACCRRRFTLVAREHRKSTINTILYTMWRLYRNPDLRIGVGCNTKTLSEAFIRELRFYFEDETLQEEVWNNRPHITGRMIPMMYRGSKSRLDDDTSAADRKVVWNQKKLQLVRLHKIYKEPSVEAVSVNVPLTGMHYDIIILDDIVDWDNSSTPAKAANVERWAEDLESVLIKKPFYHDISRHVGEWVGDELIINGTPYYRHDYYHTHLLGSTFKFKENHEELEANLGAKEYIAFIRNVFVNGKDDSDGFTFPEEFNQTIVRRLRARMRRSRFEAQFLLHVTSDEEGDLALDKGNITYILEKDIIKEHGGVIQYVRNSYDIVRIQLYMVVDLAGTVTKKSDNNAIGIGGKDWDGNLYIVDMFAKKVTPSQLIKEIFRLAVKWDLVAVYIERGNYQGTFVGSLRDSFLEPDSKIMTVLTYYYGTNKKERITNALEPYLANRKFLTHAWIVNKTPFGLELEFHPTESITDDCLDVVATISDIAKRTPSQSYSERKSAAKHILVNRKYGGVR